VNYDEALARLWNHANLPEKSATPGPEESFLATAWKVQQTKTPRDFEQPYQDILKCLQAVNLSINGLVPSESIRPDPVPVDPTLCYCMSGILTTGWSHHCKWSQKEIFSKDFLDKFASILVRIGIAWDLVLAGDMDDIPKDTELEFRMGQA
jgi:hypothetical protein